MRGTVIIIFVIATGICVSTASKNRNYASFIKNRARSREIRGFKPEHISTAIGFGKRQSFVNTSKTNKRERILSTILQYFPRGIPVEWLLRQIKTNPVFASRLTQLLVNEHGDHPNPEKIMSII